MIVADEIFRLFARYGAEDYAVDEVSQLEHALQAAQMAETQGGEPAFILAALLHDIGHMLTPAIPELDSTDEHHERRGRDWLAQYFGPAITEPVFLHVSAKRYLCAVEDDYFSRLSPASVHTLSLQGGPMSDDEVRAFEANPFANEAVALRRLDEAAKRPNQPLPPITEYRELIESLSNVADDVAT